MRLGRSSGTTNDKIPNWLVFIKPYAFALRFLSQRSQVVIMEFVSLVTELTEACLVLLFRIVLFTVCFEHSVMVKTTSLIQQ